MPISETMQDLVMHIAGGVDYATSIAKKTQKSIPVVYRQLEELVQEQFLTRQREGKRVTYTINWPSFADLAFGMLNPENDDKELFTELFKTPKIQEAFTGYLTELKKTYPAVTLTDAIEGFLEALSELTPTELKALINGAGLAEQLDRWKQERERRSPTKMATKHLKEKAGR